MVVYIVVVQDVVPTLYIVPVIVIIPIYILYIVPTQDVVPTEPTRYEILYRGGDRMTGVYHEMATLTAFDAIKAESKIFSRSIKKVSVEDSSVRVECCIPSNRVHSGRVILDYLPSNTR